ncbi:MAG TPA: hypothetical protein VNZ52_04660, partial [Candidatus Thermoplasmatota archaeon]|nr:hypothetical protein [Candidatus Thermoplasmatota archaeon]
EGAPEPVTLGGSFLVGSPTTDVGSDACMMRRAEGITSNCVALPLKGNGQMVKTFSYNVALGGNLEYCFYGAGSFLGCNHAQVPSGATHVAVFSRTSALHAQWTMTLL